MRSARRLGAPDQPAAALPARGLRPRTRYRASGRRSRRRPASVRRAVARDRSCRCESLPPARMRRAPLELALRLGIGGTAGLGHHQHTELTGYQSDDKRWQTPRLLAAKHPRQGRQPLGDRGGIIVNDVVDTAIAVLDRRDRRLGSVAEVNEGPHAAAVADQRELTLADQLVRLPARLLPCARQVKAAVAQHDALGPRRTEDCLLEMKDRGGGLALLAWWRGVERILLGLHRSAGARVKGSVALRHEPLYPHSVSG